MMSLSGSAPRWSSATDIPAQVDLTRRSGNRPPNDWVWMQVARVGYVGE
nr:hypothetical protein [Vibrio neptunius]